MVNLISKGLLLGVLCASTAFAQSSSTYPDKPIRMYVGFAPGGATDLLARYIAKELSVKLGQTVVVENKPGAGGNLAVNSLTQANPDGYTFAIAANYIVTNAALGTNPYDWQKDLTPLALVAATPNVLVVPVSSPYKNFADLIAGAKKQSLTFGSAGISTSQHLAGEMFQYLTGVKLVHVPYKGGTPAEADLIAGRVDMLFGNVTTNVKWTQAGKVRPLAITGTNRIPALGDIPTIKELGYPDYDVQALYFTVAPGKTPEPIARKLTEALQAVIKDPKATEYFATIDAIPMYGGQAATTALLQKEFEKWTAVSKATGLRIDK